MDESKAEELARRLATALRGSELYSPTHPLVQRGVEAVMSAATDALRSIPAVVIGFIGDDVVVEALRPFARSVNAPPPEVVRFTNIQHLATSVTAELLDPPADVLQLAAALHPTPAVGGWPRAAADLLIDELEGMERGWYAGAVGWIDGRGDGEFAVALRCGLLWEDGARLYAGVGVMPDSDPARELEETELKFKALLTALV